METPVTPVPSALDKFFRPVLIVLLSLILVVQTIGLITNAVETRQCKQAAEAMQLADLNTGYEKDVYDNPQVDNINKQTLINNEYQFLTQQQIAALIIACH